MFRIEDNYIDAEKSLDLKLMMESNNFPWFFLQGKVTKTDKLLKIVLFAAIFELMFKHNTPKKVIINEYLLASEQFLEKIQIGYLNAILDKIAKELRKDE